MEYGVFLDELYKSRRTNGSSTSVTLIIPLITLLFRSTLHDASYEIHLAHKREKYVKNNGGALSLFQSQTTLPELRI